jgi:hypothetical protein
MLERIERFLLFGDVTSLETQHFRAVNLGAYARTHLPDHHPAREDLRIDHLGFSSRHTHFRQQLLPLVSAWKKRGIELAFLKGFRFAEFEYNYTSERFYGDVDVLILPQHADAMKTVAQQLGWLVQYDSPDFDSTQSHDAVLKSSDGMVSLELHPVVLQSRGKTASRISKAFWDSSINIQWHDMTIRQLTPVDAVLCMYLNRAWGDYYKRKVHDILDVRVMIQKYGLTREELFARAKELNVGVALEVAMRTCDPWRGILKLGSRTRSEVWWDAICAFPNWRAFAWDLFWLRIQKSPVLLADLLEGWHLIRRAKRNLQKLTDLEKILLEMTPELAKSGQDIQIRSLRLERGVRWALRLTNQHVNACVPRSLALFHALRKEGLEVSFVSGVRRNGSKLEGHAWLELNGKPIPGLGDENAPSIFKENFRYPKL